MTSYPPEAGGDPQREPEPYGQSPGGTPQEPQQEPTSAGPGDPTVDHSQQPYPQQQQQYPQQPYPQPYPQQPYPEQAGQSYGQYGQPPHAQQYDQYGAQQYGAPQYGGQQYGGQQYGGQPVGGPGYPPPYGPPPYGQQPPPGGFPAPGAQPSPPFRPPFPVGPSPDPLVPFSFGDWLTKVTQVVGRSWKPLALIALCYTVPLVIVVVITSLIANESVTSVEDLPGFGTFLSLNLALAVVFLALYGPAQAASAFVIVRDAAGRPYRAADVWAFAMKRALPMIGWLLLAVIMIFVGFVALVLPGIYLAVVLASTMVGVVAIERGGIGRCFTLVNNHFAAVLGRMAFLYLVLGVAGLLLRFIGGLFVLVNPVLGQVLSSVLTVPVGLVGLAAVVVIYAETRFRENPAVHTGVLADELDRP